ncbi:gasdermin-A [Columba livia]|uniref:gasdermin-A n=1 Tax=Columba livia TaxID=8932 RepID=UPI0028C0247B|nr:Gsdma [Columba livia]
MFKKLTESIVNQLDPKGNLVPVPSFSDHEYFRPLCLVKRKRKSIFHLFPRYELTHYRLDNMLLPREGIEPLFANGGDRDSSKFTLKISSSDRVDGSLSVPADRASTGVTGAASSSQAWSITLQKNRIPLAELDALQAKRKLDMNHTFIQQLKKSQQVLYVVHETIEASEETSYEERTEAGGGFMAKFYAKFNVKGTTVKKQSMTIPKGCTLAFRAIQLGITDESWYLTYFPYVTRTMFVSDGSPPGKLGEVEVELLENCQILSTLSPDLLGVFLKAIKAAMRDRNLFQELTQKMEAVLHDTGGSGLETESPELKELLSSLQNSSRDLLLELARAIAYTLDALDALTEDQLVLLLEALEEKILPQWLKLVESILEHDIEDTTGPFSVDPALLSFPQEKGQELTIALVGMSRVKLQKDGSAACMDNAFPAIAALYVSLYVLSFLSNSD